MDVFVKDADDYNRDLNLYKHYCEDKAKYISLMTGRSYEEALEYVTRVTKPDGEFGIKDPKIKLLVRNKEGDREFKITTFTKYLAAVEKRNAILSPSLTAYLHPNERLSEYSVSMDRNIKKRKVVKKQMFDYEKKGEALKAVIADIIQTGLKLNNNGTSGAFCAPSTPIYNRSAHSSLTSCCRSATSSTNALNEKFLSGNRHYYHPEVVKENIISIINNSNYDLIAECMTKYNLMAPSVDQCIDCIVRCSEKYWQSDKQMIRLKKLLSSLNDLQRAAFMFTSDIYQMKVVNPEFTYKFLSSLSQKVEEKNYNEFKMTDGDVRVLATMKCAAEISIIGTDKAEKDKELQALIRANYSHITDVVNSYDLYIKAFLATDNTPASIAMMPHHVRNVVLASDTDSSIFTVQDWVNWLVPGRTDRNAQIRVNSAMTFLVSQQVIHLLAIISGNMNVPKEHLFRLAMKNEFFFESFVLTNMGKHYFATQTAREGNFYPKPKLELKGVHLRSSNVPNEIKDRGNSIINDILAASNHNEQFSAPLLLKRIGDIERFIINSIKKGEIMFLTKAQVKEASVYAKPMSSNYQYYEMWEQVFAPKYGHAPPPQYIGLKAKIDKKNKTELAEWLEEIEDKALAKRMNMWLQANGKDKLGVIVLPMDIVANSGIPEEIISGMNIRGLIAENIGMIYKCLESLGLYYLNPKHTRLVSDEH